jgi:hypothetical protein
MEEGALTTGSIPAVPLWHEGVAEQGARVPSEAVHVWRWAERPGGRIEPGGLRQRRADKDRGRPRWQRGSEHNRRMARSENGHGLRRIARREIGTGDGERDDETGGVHRTSLPWWCRVLRA